MQDDFTELQNINSRWQNLGTQVSRMTTTLEHLIDKEEISPQPIFDLEETMKAVTLKNVELDEFSIVDEYLSEPGEALEDDHAVTKSFVLKVSVELPILKEGMHVSLPKVVDAPFVVDISKGEGIT
ncbi:hypothetical protein Sjap_011246 [Stephania japonica]|uniref:Uncharacterized protein n=1 Tax=Stephania japonica TaxID=461633 RepID=A0AAP0JBB3_9MAGN